MRNRNICVLEKADFRIGQGRNSGVSLNQTKIRAFCKQKLEQSAVKGAQNDETKFLRRIDRIRYMVHP